MKETKGIWEFLKPIITAVVITSAVLIFAQPTIVRGESMLPNYRDGDYLITTRNWGAMPEKRDVVIVRSNYNGGELLIKRVIATEGDTVSFEDGYVFVNDEPLMEPYVKKQKSTYPQDKERYELGEGQIFCMGDNRENSADSRCAEVGVINKDDVIGIAAFRLFPLTRIGGVE